MPLRTSLAPLLVVALALAGARASADGPHDEAATHDEAPLEGAPSADRAVDDDAGADAPPPPRLPAGTTVTFPYEQERLVRAPSRNGGLVYTTAGVSGAEPAPVVVFLHGMNAFGLLHMGFAAPALDLRTVVDALVVSGRVRPLVLAAPSHSRRSHAARIMWPDFDLPGFLDAAEAALAGGARLDRARVVVVGHSGAGCNLAGGLFSNGVRRAAPMAVLAVDTCVDDRIVAAYTALAAAVPVRFYWQRSWPRPVAALAQSCVDCFVEEVDGLPFKTAHGAILAEALDRALPEVLPTP